MVLASVLGDLMEPVPEGRFNDMELDVLGCEHRLLPFTEEPVAAVIANWVATDTNHMEGTVAPEFRVLDVIDDVPVIHNLSFWGGDRYHKYNTKNVCLDFLFFICR
jgi:hypothetical protein